MKLPVRWLKEYIDVTLSPQKLEELLTLSGTKVESLEGALENAVLDLEITTNRPDCLSLLGLAHELSALTGKRVFSPYPTLKDLSAKKSKEVAVPIFVEDKKGCPRYTARLIRNVSVKPSPAIIQSHLTAMGTRPISNAVDATNFVLFEIGQPLHVFDFDKLKGGLIKVRRAKSGEKILGIDGIEYTLDPQTLVIADAERPVAIAGVIGGKDTEVTDQTRNVLLESAYFDPAAVRQTAKKFKISTESSYRFERAVNPERIGIASARASQLIIKWAGGQDVSGLLEKDYFSRPKTETFVVRLERLHRLLGITIPQKRILTILKNLSIPAKAVGKEKALVTRSAARRDIQSEADVAEEVLRIEGFDKIPVTIPVTHHPMLDIQNKKAAKVLELKKYLASLGFQEIINYSLVSERTLKNSGADVSSCHRVANPVSVEQEYFRPSLLSGVLSSLLFNIHRKASSLKFFEIGNCYVNGAEETRLALALTGGFEENWRRKEEVSYYDLKGILENIKDFSGVAAQATKLSLDLLKNWDIPRDVYYAETSLESLGSAKPAISVRRVPKFPLVRRDIAFVIDQGVRVADLEELMKNSLAPHLVGVHLFDQYIGKNIPSGKRSLAFSLAYQKENGTFTEDEINALQSRLTDALKKAHAIEFR